MATTDALDSITMLKFLGFVVLLLQIANLISGFVRGHQAKRRVVTFEGNPVEKAEFEKHVATNQEQHDHLFSKLGGEARGIRAEVKADTVRIEDKISSVDRKMSGLENSNQQQNIQLGEMRTTLRDMPGEIIALLKNTGAIK